MAISGVTLHEGVVGAMADVRMKRSRYAIFHIGDDGQQILVSEVGPRETTYADFKSKISSSEPCYAAFDFEYNDGQSRDKLLLILWIPDTAKPRGKLIYSASRDALNLVSEGYLLIQANDFSELNEEEIIGRIKIHRSV